MNETIEQAARALWGEWSLWAPPIRAPKPSWDELAEGNKDIARRMVVAVITAIRAPTHEALAAGAQRSHEPVAWGQPRVPYLQDAGAVVWERVIDAILTGDRP